MAKGGKFRLKEGERKGAKLGGVKKKERNKKKEEVKPVAVEDEDGTLISVGWAFAAIKKYAKKTFQEKEWAYENLHEVFWMILHQRPQMRGVIVEACKAESQEYAVYWRRISTRNFSIADVPRDIPLVTGDPLDPSIVVGGPFLNFSPEMHKLIFVNTESLLSKMSAKIEKRAERPEGVTVGLDAEWSAYENRPGARILQISLNDVSYIVDIDCLPRGILRPFIEMLFSHPKILKLGFQFQMDLIELRRAESLKGCVSLNDPMNLSCILKLIVALTEATVKHPNRAEILDEFGLESSTDPATNTEKTVTSSKLLTYGYTPSLSSICEALLGLPLCKREQCSVWTRRPLRALQLRYAAMDSFCLLLLHSRCQEWAERLGVSMKDVEEIAGINAKKEEERRLEAIERKEQNKVLSKARTKARRAEMKKKQKERKKGGEKKGDGKLTAFKMKILSGKLATGKMNGP